MGADSAAGRRHRCAWRAAVAGLAVGAAASLWGASAAAQGRLDGVWRSRGYGRVVQIDHGQVRQWDLDRLGCRVGDPPKPIGQLFDRPRLLNRGRVLEAGNPRTDLTRFRYDRTADLPAACRHPLGATRDPMAVFDAFWTLFDEHYAFFRERGVDWAALRERYRPRIGPQTTDDDLFAVLRDMVLATHDLHVSLEAGARTVIPGFDGYLTELWARYDQAPEPRPDLSAFLKTAARADLQPALDGYLAAGTARVLDPNVMVARLDGGAVGYIQVLGEEGFARQSGADRRLSRELRAAAAVLDQAFTDVAGARGLILDLRVNFGGEDATALNLAGRLADRPTAGFGKCARMGAGYTDLQRTTVTPVRPGFTGPVVLLVSHLTISAGDELLMIAKDFPNVVVVGEISPGMYADPLHKSLPNGWSVGISNERYLAPDGRLYEGRGIAPDVRVGFDPDLIRAQRRDPGLEKALDVLDILRRKGRAALPRAARPPAAAQACGPSAR